MLEHHRPLHIHLILEGHEEESFFDIVQSQGVSESLRLTYVNACGAQRVAAKYQDAISNDEYDLVLAVYDVDYKESVKDSSYNVTKAQLAEVTGSILAAEMVSYYTNPNILLWFLLGTDSFDEIKGIRSSKAENTILLHTYWSEIGKGMETSLDYKRYDAKDWQLDVMKNSYLYGTYRYEDILEHGKDVPKEIHSPIPGSNLLELLTALYRGDEAYFEDLIRKSA